MSDLPNPPYPSETRAKGWRFELDYEQIEQSDTWALAGAELRPWLLMLWIVAWKQAPCGSLPNSDDLIAAKLGMKQQAFGKIRSILMRGWTEASDGRLYHATIAAKVIEMNAARDKTADRKRGYDKKLARIRERDGGACVYCGETKYLSLDHLIAVSVGGSGEDSNLVMACRDCNSTKGAKNPEQAGLSFINNNAELLWNAARTEWRASVSRAERARNALHPREERGPDDTGTGTGTSTRETKNMRAVALTVAELSLDGLPEDLAGEWLAQRSRKRANLTARAWTTIKAEASKANLTPAQAVEKCIARGWTGFEAEWVLGGKLSPSAAFEAPELSLASFS